MPSRQPLIPVPVTDKNGRQTTRWKRSDTPSNSSTLIPAVPSPDVQKTHYQQLQETPGRVAELLVSHMDKQKWGKKLREEKLAELHPDTLPILDEQFSDGISIPIKECMKRRSLVTLNNMATFKESREYFNSDGKFTQAVSGLQWHWDKKEGRDIDYSTLGPDDKERGEALIYAAATLDKPYRRNLVFGSHSMSFIESEKLADLIERRPEDVGRIIEVVTKRELSVDTSDDIQNIESLLDGSEVGSLGDGVL